LIAVSAAAIADFAAGSLILDCSECAIEGGMIANVCPFACGLATTSIERKAKNIKILISDQTSRVISLLIPGDGTPHCHESSPVSTLCR